MPKRWKWVIFGLLFGLSMIIDGSLVRREVHAEKVTIRAISAWPKSVWEVHNFMKFLHNAEERVGRDFPGQVELKYMGGPEVIPNREQVEALRQGLVDMVFTTDGYYVSLLPEVNALSLSFLDPLEERKRGINALLDSIHRKRVNAVYLGRAGVFLPFVMHLTKPIRKLSDLKGMKIRCSPTLIPFLKRLGAKPVVIPPPEVYTALERGVVQGFMWPGGLIRDWGWHEVIRYIVSPGVYHATNVILMNLSVWEKLPKGVQAHLMDATDWTAQYAKKRSEELLEKEYALYRKMGIKLIDLSPEDAKAFKETAQDALWDVIITKSPENGKRLRELIGQ